MYFNSKLPLYIVLGPAIIHAPYVSPANPSQRGRQGSINSKTTSHAFFGVVTFMLSTTQRHPERGRGSVSGRALDFGLIGVSTCGFESHQGPFRSLTFPPVLRDWVIKGLGMSSLVYATGHIKDPVPLIEKRRGLSLGGRFPPSFIHQVIIITRLNKLQLYVLALKMALDADRA